MLWLNGLLGYLDGKGREHYYSLGDIEDFGRKQPWVVIGGGIALGIAASRFLKASSSRRYEQRSSGAQRLPARTPAVEPPARPISTPATPGTAGAGVPLTPEPTTTGRL